MRVALGLFVLLCASVLLWLGLSSIALLLLGGVCLGYAMGR